MAEKSASNNAVTCGASLTARTIFSAILSRIRSCGMSPGARLRGWAVAGSPALTTVAAATARSTSSRVIRPPRPVPVKRAGSMPCWRIARFTEGERRSSSSVPRRRPRSRSARRRSTLRVAGPRPSPGNAFGSRYPPQQRPRHRLGIRIQDNLAQHPRRRRGHLLRDLVGLQLDQRIVDRDRYPRPASARRGPPPWCLPARRERGLRSSKTPPAGRSRRGFARPTAPPLRASDG